MLGILLLSYVNDVVCCHDSKELYKKKKSKVAPTAIVNIQYNVLVMRWECS